jgi:hypothetical protein
MGNQWSGGGKRSDRNRFLYMILCRGWGWRGKVKGRANPLAGGGVGVVMLVGIVVCNLVDLASCPGGFF